MVIMKRLLISATKFNKDTFHTNTKCAFMQAITPEREPDFVSDSGSTYWYEKDGVFRQADHWGNDIGSCNWALRDYDDSGWDFDGGLVTGYAKWSWFKDLEEQ